MSLNPFKKLPNGRAVFAWGIYDLANQSFQLLINTLLFSLFVQSVIVGDEARGKQTWSYMVGASLVIIVLLSPVVGAVADQRAWKRELLLMTGVVCAFLTGMLGILQPNQVLLAATLYIVAAVACGLGENLLAAFLPEISTPKNVGYISALGWTMSYIGALILLLITAGVVYGLNRPDPAQARPLFVFSGIWFFVGIIPAVLYLREKAQPQPAAAGTIAGAAFRRLIKSARETRRFRQLARFLAVFFVYSLGTQTVIYFLGLIGDSFGFDLGQLLVFAFLIALTAGIAAALVGRYQDSLGHRRTISIILGVWVVSTIAMALMQHFSAPRWLFWAVSAGIGLGLGGIGTASRALVGAFTPESRAAEFFGLWGMLYKLSGVVGVVAFGAVFSRSAVGALVLLSCAFIAGLFLLRFIDEKEGVAAAQSTESPPATASPPSASAS